MKGESKRRYRVRYVAHVGRFCDVFAPSVKQAVKAAERNWDQEFIEVDEPWDWEIEGVELIHDELDDSEDSVPIYFY
ncbi:MAG: hypothetical protein AAF670_18135 [Planctomycetota bacterium]